MSATIYEQKHGLQGTINSRFLPIQNLPIQNLFLFLSLSAPTKHVSIFVCGKKSVVNPFVPNAPFLYPLKTSEKLKVFWCFQGVEKGCIGNEWVKMNNCRIGKRCKYLTYLFEGLLSSQLHRSSTWKVKKQTCLVLKL